MVAPWCPGLSRSIRDSQWSLSVEPPVATAIPARFRGRARRDAAAFYLSQLSKGLLSGDLMVVSGDQPTALVAAEFLVLEINVKRGKRVNHVEVRVRWPAGAAPG